jgi:hypothetical protein
MISRQTNNHRVDAGLRAERAGLDRIRDALPTDPLDALSWASERCKTAARWRAWETVRRQGVLDLRQEFAEFDRPVALVPAADDPTDGVSKTANNEVVPWRW